MDRSKERLQDAHEKNDRGREAVARLGCRVIRSQAADGTMMNYCLSASLENGGTEQTLGLKQWANKMEENNTISELSGSPIDNLEDYINHWVEVQKCSVALQRHCFPNQEIDSTIAGQIMSNTLDPAACPAQDKLDVLKAVYASQSPRGGKLTLIIGPMFSGKTEELMRLARRARIASSKCLVVRSTKDNRYGDGALYSHANRKDTESYPASTLKEVEDNLIMWYYDMIFIDEGQFFPDLVKFCLKWVARGKRVLVSALDAYSNQELWPVVAPLLPYAVKISLTAICHKCNGPATLTGSRKDQGAEEVVGGIGEYYAVCSHCHLREREKHALCTACGEAATNAVDFDEGEAVVCQKCIMTSK